METKKIILNKESIELKYSALCKRINETYNKLKDISCFVDCSNEINSIKIIKQQYEKMYKAVWAREEYDKYQEIENTIIQQIAKIESKVDKYIYSISKRFDGILDEWFRAIRETENYKNFNNLDKELEKVKQLKGILEYCKIYFSRAQENQINTKISTFKFELLIRRQIEQMVYQNGTVHDGNGFSRLMNYDDLAEYQCFYKLFEPMINKRDKILEGHHPVEIMRNNRLLNHMLFGIVTKEIRVNPEKYIGLLEASVFNPHMCNIADDPFKEEIPYLEIKERPLAERILGVKDYQRNPLKWNFYTRKKANLSLLKAVLADAISDYNTTIMECDNIYKRFGFECRPIVISEGQELIWRVYQKTKHMLKTKQESKQPSGKFAKVKFVGYDYDFKLEDEPYTFLTHASIIHRVKELCSNMSEFDDYRKNLENMIGTYNYLMSFENLDLTEMQMIGERRGRFRYELTKQSNAWARTPLEKMSMKRPDRPYNKKLKYLGFDRYEQVKEYDETALWESYKADFEEMGLTVEKIGYDIFKAGNEYFIAISLDDISDLPIDTRKAEILTAEQLKKAKEEYEEER